MNPLFSGMRMPVSPMQRIGQAIKDVQMLQRNPEKMGQYLADHGVIGKDQINEISKKIFLDKDFSEIYSDYSYTNNERLTTYLTDNFEECRSKLIRGVGFIPGENEMELDETIYVGNYNDQFYVDSVILLK